MKQRTKKNLMIGVTAGIGIILILIAFLLVSNEYRFQTYGNEQDGFTIQYPASWSLEENKNGAAVIFYSPQENAMDFFQESVSVILQDISTKPKELNKYSKQAIEEVEAVFGETMTVLESKPFFFAGQSGFKFDFLGETTEEAQLHYKMVWTLRGLTGYQVTYTALSSRYEHYLPKVNRMIRSFRIY